MKEKINYKQIVNHYLECFEKHGDTPKGMDWPNMEDLIKRYQVMSEIVQDNDKFTLLDFGCGTGNFSEYLKTRFENFEYTGLDMGEAYIEHCKKHYPELTFLLGDILDDKTLIHNYDYIIMNGVLTEKRKLTTEQMWNYMQSLISVLFEKTNKGLAFNVMSKNVDWEVDDLFHLSLDKLSDFLCKNLTRNFVIRNDYGLYEYTVYIIK